MNMNNRLLNLCAASVLAALVFAVTFLVRVPLPFTQGGYLNLGDAVILAGACVLVSRRREQNLLSLVLYGAFIGGFGSALADLIAGAAIYVPGTLIIKAVMGAAAVLLLNRRRSLPRYAGASAIVGTVMLTGYFLYEWLVFDIYYALAGLSFNSLQLVGCVMVSPVLYAVVRRVKVRSF